MIKRHDVKIGKMPTEWKDGLANNITFTVTEDCNLRCGYCYMTHKNDNTVMPWDIARIAVDFFLSHHDILTQDSVVLDFIGGEPFLEIELIDRIVDYFKIEAYKRDHPWFSSYRINLSTNGLLYDTPPVQRFIRKNHQHLSIGVSVDGSKLKHDLQRVKPDGTGSFDDVARIVPLWLEQFPGSTTKSTFSHDDLPFLKESVIALWNMGIRYVMANVVFEDVWHEGDDEIFERQIKELGDYILENEIWRDDFSVRFLNPDIGYPLSEEERIHNSCGAGKMIAVDAKGNLFPCVRFQKLSLTRNKERSVGNIFEGINPDKVRPFLALNMLNQSPEECKECNVASGCALCVGNNYDMTEMGSIYSRATFICKMHKANVRACEYFWNKFEKTTGLPSERKFSHSESDAMNDKTMFFMTSDNAAPYCAYSNKHLGTKKIDYTVFVCGLQFAKENGYTPVILEGENSLECHAPKDTLHIAYADSVRDAGTIPVYDNCSSSNNPLATGDNCIILIDDRHIGFLSRMVGELGSWHNRINVVLQNVMKWNDADLDVYAANLRECLPLIIDRYASETRLEVNVITDALDLKKMCNCNAGTHSITLAPDGNFYPCPAFYLDGGFKPIGNIESGITCKETFLFGFEHSGICHACNACHCKRCIYLNAYSTDDITVPSKIQCLISHTELQITYELQEQLFECGRLLSKKINPVACHDPLEIILSHQKGEAVCQ